MSSEPKPASTKSGDTKGPTVRQSSSNNEAVNAEPRDLSGPQNIQDMTNWFPAILEQIQSRFQTMSDQIIGRIDEMAQRIDDLEQSLNDIMMHANIPDEQTHPPTRSNSAVDKSNSNIETVDRS